MSDNTPCIQLTLTRDQVQTLMVEGARHALARARDLGFITERAEQVLLTENPEYWVTRDSQ